MNDDNLITWTATNFITIVLMGVVAFAIYGFGAKFWASRKGSAAPASA